VIGLALIFAIAACCWNQVKPKPKSTPAPAPKQIRYRSIYATGDATLAKSTADGNCMLEYAPLPNARRLVGVARYDWEGRVCWRITMPELPGVSRYEEYNLVFSPDGNCAALALTENKTVHLLAWTAGKPVTDIRLPMPHYPVLAIENSGRLWVVENALPTATLYALDGNTVIATGTHTSPLKASPGAYVGRGMAPNGSALMTYREEEEGRRISGPDVEYAALQIAGKRIVITQHYAWQAVGGHFLDDGLMIADGTSYHAKGRMARKTRLCFGGQFGTSVLMTDELLDKWYVLNPGAKLRWQIPADFKIYGIAPNGRAVAGYQDDKQGTLLNIYQYPGPLAASLRLEDHRFTGPLRWVRKVNHPGPPIWGEIRLKNEHDQTLSTRNCYPSPDGHRVVMETFGSQDQPAYYLFGW